MIPTAETIPTMIDAIIPLDVVRFQNSIMMMQGRFAEAATAKARPTRKDTLMPWNANPSRMAMAPTTKAAILPAWTFMRSDLMTPPKRSSRSCATAPDAAMMRPLTVPRTVAKAMAEIMAKRKVPNDWASNGADMLLSSRLMVPLVMAPRPRKSVRM